jgi:hypothetical protein
MSHVVETKEVIEILPAAICSRIFSQISDGIQAVVLGAGLQDVKKYRCILHLVAYWVVGLQFQFIWGCILTCVGWDLIDYQIIFAALFFCIFASLSTNKNFVVREICK